ncbi:hypothetical protein JCGZ_22827 [Jatropha curcas]|uniref:RING-type E3 ubiquitin transferase n=1 Tax=Jatropha curcas TaxID=180498 RepID=A0A067LFL1_JATCU|nr:hypothetical protein JCGZ_22827 [Jatropha curcas]
MAAMDVFQIAKQEAEILHRRSNWELYSTFDGADDPRTFTGKLDSDGLKLAKLETTKQEIARQRAKATNREFEIVLKEVELEVLLQLGKILAMGSNVFDPLLKGLKSFIVEREGDVCSVCLLKMEIGEEGKAMECMHRFHGFCIVQWLRRKKTCPLCRYEMQI